MAMELCLIGSGAVRTAGGRGGPGQLISTDSGQILIDCGRDTVSNLARFGFQVEEINTVLITHLHFDHICDLAHFILLSWNNGRKERLRLYGPPGLRDFLEYGITKAYAEDIRTRIGHGKETLGIEWEVNEIEKDGLFIEENDLRVSAVFTPHADMANINYAVESGGVKAAVSSDSKPVAELAVLFKDADIAVSECSGTKEFLESVPWGSWHVWPEKLAELAEKAGVKKLILKHLVIEDWSDIPNKADEMAETIQKQFSGEVIVGYDGLKLRL
jgi:ribonuclease Z